jgi:uncharacterized protein (DUF305 family)
MKGLGFLPAISVCAGIALTAVSFVARAQQSPLTRAGQMNTSGPSGADSAASTQAFKEGGKRMTKGMNAPYSGDADKDFVSHMIPHHQGAVEMAEVELKYGKDPEMRKLAADIIKAQKGEIGRMKKWETEHRTK